MALLPAHAQSPYPTQWDKDRREPRAPGSQLWEPAARVLSDTVTAPTASRSSVGQQVQLGPRWPDSCCSRPPAVTAAQRLEPAPERGGGGARAASSGPFLVAGDPAASGPRRSRVHPVSLSFLSCSVSNSVLPCPPPLPSVGTATMDHQILLSHLAPLQPGSTTPFPAITLRPTSFTLPLNPLLLPKG